MGPAQVVDLTEAPQISAQSLGQVTLEESRHLLLKTRNSRLLGGSAYRDDYVSLTPDAAEVLLAARPRSIGFDYYNLDPPDASGYPVHRRLAREGMPVCVCLDLRGVPAGQYLYVCLPLRLPGADGSPVRAVLFNWK
jgi:arylformamidase